MLLFVLLLACSTQEPKPIADPHINPQQVAGMEDSETVRDTLAARPADPDQSTDSHESGTTVGATAIQAEEALSERDGMRTNRKPRLEEEEEAIPEAITGHQTDESPAGSDSAPGDVGESDVPEPVAPPTTESARRAWNDLLQRAVSPDGRVDYDLLLANRPTLAGYLETTNDGPPSGLMATRAYWINQYNAYTLELVLAHWPVSSIKDIHHGNPWDHRWIEIDGELLSLNQIEFEKLRPGQTDARLHFAVNCAATSCPPLYNRLFEGRSLNATLDRLAVNFINDARFNQLDQSPWQISQLFQWYTEDFGDPLAFIQQFAAADSAPAGQVTYKTYDWKLNN